MSVSEFAVGKNERSLLGGERGARLPLPNQLNHTKHRVTIGRVVPLPGEAGTRATHTPTLLELYRQDPVAVRQGIQRQAHRARNACIRGFVARCFSAAWAR
jgi:hypothetical protein